jgi:putative phage-type endonuclease
MTLSPQALERRSRGLGSSDAATALGLNPYKSPFRLWQEKRGEIEPDDLSDNEAVELGTLLEPIVSELFERRTGKRLHRVNQTIEHPRLEFMVCNIDRRVVGEPALAEIKTAGFWAAQSDEWGEPGTDAVPFKYAVQVHHQLACLPKYEVGYIPLLVAGQHFKLYEVRRDEGIVEMLERMLGAFWQCVIEGTPPAPTTLEQAKERWPHSASVEIEATAEIVDAVRLLKEHTATIKALDAMKHDVQGRIAVFMGEADTLVAGGKTILTYKTQERAAYTVQASSARIMRPK